jgi:hypothetical protein
MLRGKRSRGIGSTLYRPAAFAGAIIVGGYMRLFLDKCFRITATAAVSSTFIVAAEPSAASCLRLDQARLEIRMYRYAGTGSAAAQDKFELFHRSIFDKIVHFQQRDQVSTELGYLAKMAIVPKPGELKKIQEQPDYKGLSDTWEAYANYLLLLSGSIEESEPGKYTAYSKIYWGTLRPQELGDIIEAQLAITARNGAKSMDSHSLVTLFTLALDARNNLKCGTEVWLALLQEALDQANDLERRGELGGDLIKVKEHILFLIQSQIG